MPIFTNIPNDRIVKYLKPHYELYTRRTVMISSRFNSSFDISLIKVRKMISYSESIFSIFEKQIFTFTISWFEVLPKFVGLFF